jgi:hypothetical protein
VCRKEEKKEEKEEKKKQERWSKRIRIKTMLLLL